MIKPKHSSSVQTIKKKINVLTIRSKKNLYENELQHDVKVMKKVIWSASLTAEFKNKFMHQV